MKLIKSLSLLVLTFEACLTIAQTSSEIDKANNERYWIYRDRFRKKFINIGGVEDGQSLPFIQFRENSLAPVIDKDHVNDHITDAEKRRLFTVNTADYKGRLSKGEMGIELGNYIAVLATEYRLLQWDGADLTAIRNELYYAINAINRLDKNAEPYFKEEFKTHNDNLNGFLMREDIPHGFYRRWENLGDPVHTQGTQSSGIYAVEQKEYTPYDENGNPLPNELRFFDKRGHMIDESAGKTDWVCDERFGRDYENNRYGGRDNEFSQDQTFGILLGLSFVVKYVDDDFVKPLSTDQGFNLVTESKAIVHRILTFFAANKLSLPQIKPACGNNTPGYIEDGRTLTTDNCDFQDLTAEWTIRNPTNQKAAWRGPNAYQMGFMWPMSVLSHNMNDEILDWDISVNYHRHGNYYYNFNANGKNRFNDNFTYYNNDQLVTNWDFFYNASHLIRNACFAGKDGDDYILTHDQVFSLATKFDRPHMEIIYAALNDKTPKMSQQTYQSLLAKAPCGGPFMTENEKASFSQFKETFDDIFIETITTWAQGQKITENQTLINQFAAQLQAIKDSRGIWYREGTMYIHRFWEFDDGEFNGIDYMLLHNLYRLKFSNNIEDNFVTTICPCLSSKQFLDTDKSPISIIGISYPQQIINTVFRFPEYKAFSVPVPEYLTHHFWIMDGGTLNVTGDLTIGCSSTEINNGGVLKVLKSTSTSKQKYLTISKAGGLIVKEGGTLYVEDGNTVIIEEEGVLNVLAGSHIVLNGPNAILEIRGKLVLGANAIFKIEGGALGRGYVKWNMAGITSGTEARSRMIFGANSRIELIGTGKTDKILEVNDHIFWPDNNYGAIAASVILKNGKIEMGKNAIMNIGTAIELNTVKIVPKAGASSFKGIILWGNKHTIYQTEIEGSRDGLKSFNMVGGYDFKATGLSINNSLNGLSIEGKGYQVAVYSANVIYTGGMQSGINATGIDRESRISLANITNCTKGIIHTGNIGGGLSVHNSAIGAYSYGIEFKSPASLLAQCNEISAIPLTATSFTIGITSTGGKSELAPSLGRNAGGNIFHHFSYSIFIDRNNLYLNEGNNNLSSFTNTPDRAVFGEAIGVPLSGTLSANHNIWDVNFNPPYSAPSPSANYNVWYKPTGTILSPLTYTDNSVITTTPQFMTGRVARCNNTYVGGAIGGLYPSDKNINTTSFVNTNIKNAFETTLDKMYNPVGMDFVIASANWNEILTCEWLLPLSFNDYYYVSLGIDKMMENVGLYLINDSIEANSLTINNTVLANANSTLVYWKNLTSTDTNYYSKQINQQATLANAQILHNANDFVTSKNLIDNLVLTSSGTWQQQADYWQCQWLRENAIKMSDNNPDSIAIANWPNCYCGDNNSNALVAMNLEEKTLKKENKMSKHLNIYPNPATTSVTAELETTQYETAIIAIYSAEGKCIKTIPNTNLQIGVNKLNIPVSDIARGVYTITIETSTIKWNDKMIIK